MEKMMVDNDSQLNPSAYFNTFKVSLTREQQKALAMLLPQSCSFQPFKATRSLDEESLKSEPKHQKSKEITIQKRTCHHSSKSRKILITRAHTYLPLKTQLQSRSRALQEFQAGKPLWSAI
jgi:hypothetical protein